MAALLGRAFQAETWDAAGTERELFCDETVRATLVVAAEGRLVATASLQVRPDAPECGWVRWVATEQDRRREGLARALVIGVLAMAGQAGCREARLHTQTDRLAAIALYLQLGFEPLVRGDPEREVWERVIRLLSGDGWWWSRFRAAGWLTRRCTGAGPHSAAVRRLAFSAPAAERGRSVSRKRSAARAQTTQESRAQGDGAALRLSPSRSRLTVSGKSCNGGWLRCFIYAEDIATLV